MPSITMLPVSNAKFLDVSVPIPTDIGIEENHVKTSVLSQDHISDGFEDISIALPSADEVDIPIPSAKDAVIPKDLTTI